MNAIESNNQNKACDSLQPCQQYPYCCGPAFFGGESCEHQTPDTKVAETLASLRRAGIEEAMAPSFQTIIPELDMDAKFAETFRVQRAAIDAKTALASSQTLVSSSFEAPTSAQRIDDIPRPFGRARSRTRTTRSYTPTKLASQPSSPSSNLSFEGFRELPQLPEKSLSEILKARYGELSPSLSSSPTKKLEMQQAVDSVLKSLMEDMAKMEQNKAQLPPFDQAMGDFLRMHTNDDRFPILVRRDEGTEMRPAAETVADEKSVVEDERFQETVTKAVGTFMAEHGQSIIETAVAKAVKDSLEKKAEIDALVSADSEAHEAARETAALYALEHDESSNNEVMDNSFLHEAVYNDDEGFDDESMGNDYDAEQYFDN